VSGNYTNGFFEAMKVRRADPPKPTECSHCGRVKPLKLVGAMTAYEPEPYSLWVAVVYDDRPPDPNPSSWLCAECEVEHDEFWTAMWDEYNSGRL